MVWAEHYLATFQADYRFPSAANELIQWKHGRSRWVTLNTDGALNTSSSIGSVVGLLRDHEGSWLFGFNKHIGISSILEAKL
ncbi:hypothetical protein V6N11_072182 [Hibiscus sabdariffa]|uniref:RNase H type-1 domain-containing protein n=1 Tax=Hibiscus sabdariffa TaxID=183260 RepID=A0ABR2U294_9ROSI